MSTKLWINPTISRNCIWSHRCHKAGLEQCASRNAQGVLAIMWLNKSFMCTKGTNSLSIAWRRECLAGISDATALQRMNLEGYCYADACRIPPEGALQIKKWVFSLHEEQKSWQQWHTERGLGAVTYSWFCLYHLSTPLYFLLFRRARPMGTEAKGSLTKASAIIQLGALVAQI